MAKTAKPSSSPAKPPAKPSPRAAGAAPKAPAKATPKVAAKPAPKTVAKPESKSPKTPAKTSELSGRSSGSAKSSGPAKSAGPAKSSGKAKDNLTAAAPPSAEPKRDASASSQSGKSGKSGNGSSSAGSPKSGKAAAPAAAASTVEKGRKAPKDEKAEKSQKVDKTGKAAKPEKALGGTKKTDRKSADKGDEQRGDKPGEKTKKSSSKRGPIDLSTARSVAAVAAASQADSSGYVLINGRRVRMISTKGLPAPKRPKVVAEKEAEKPEVQVSAIKTKLTKKELDDYRSLLLAKRRQIIGTISGLEDEALRSSGGNLSNMPLHMADIGTDTFDQDFTLGMAQTERQTLGEIDAALQRIENKTYGVCQLTGKPIPKARLEAKPWAKFSIEAAKLVERGMAPR